MNRYGLVLLALIAGMVWVFLGGVAKQSPLPNSEVSEQSQKPFQEAAEHAPQRVALRTKDDAVSAGVLGEKPGLCVRCVDHSGVPIPDLEVRVLERWSVFGDTHPPRSMRASEDGLICFEPASGLREFLVVSRDTGWMADGRWRSNVEEDVVIVKFIVADIELHGVVQNSSGDPLSGALVACRGRSVISGENGSYRLWVGRSWSRYLLTTLVGYQPLTSVLEIKSVSDLDLDLTLIPAKPVGGTVVDVDQAAVAEAWVTGGSGYGGAWSNRAGGFQVFVNPLDPALIVEHRDFPAQQYDISRGNLSDATHRIVLRSGRPLSGVVKTSLGQVIPGARILLTKGLNSKSCQTDRFGRFIAEGVLPGRVAIAIVASGYVTREMNIQHGGNSEVAQCVIEKGAQVYGSVVDERGVGVGGVVVRVLKDSRPGKALPGSYMRSGRALTGGDGAFLIEDMPPIVALEIGSSGYQSDVFYNLSMHDSPHVLRVRESGVIRGVVSDRNSGLPVTRFRVRFVDGELLAGEAPLVGNRSVWREIGIEFVSADARWSTGRDKLVPGTVIGIEVSATGYETLYVPRVIARPLVGAREEMFTLDRL